VEKIPYTVSGKKTELAVLDVVQGKQPTNVEALADPTALDCFRNLPELSSPPLDQPSGDPSDKGDHRKGDQR
jgi:hypothetical protein